MIARRHLLGLLGVVPFMGTPQRPDQAYDPPVSGLAPSSQSGVFIGRRVVVFSSDTAFNGVFVYSPTPGLNNLIASITSASGTDPYGNAYKTGVTSYVGGQTSQLAGGLVNVTNQFNNAAVPGGLSATSSTAGLTELLSPTTGAGDVQAILAAYSKNGIAGGPMFLASANWVATNPSAGGAESWHNIALVAGQFGVSSGLTPQYRLEAIGGGRVFTRGVVALLANQISGATIGTVAAGWRPPASRFFLCPNQLSGSVNANTTFGIDTTGTMTLEQSGTAGNTFGLDGLSWDIG